MLKRERGLGRNLRYSLVDVAALLDRSQMRHREGAPRYVHLLRKKREWELEQIKKLLSNDPTREGKGALVNRYNEVVSIVTDLKERFRKQDTLRQTIGLPELTVLQRNLSIGEAFVAYFPIVGWDGEICGRRDGQQHTVSVPFDEEEARRTHPLADFATTADYPPDPKLDLQFPVSSAIYLYNVLFAGLESCLVPGTHVTVALPSEFASVPLGALLRRSHPDSVMASSFEEHAGRYWI